MVLTYHVFQKFNNKTYVKKKKTLKVVLALNTIPCDPDTCSNLKVKIPKQRY